MILPPCQSLCVMRLYKKGQAIYYHQSVCLCLEQSLTVQLSCRTRETTESFESLVFSVWLLVLWWMLSDLKYLVDFWWICSQPPLLFLSPGRCASCGENVVGEGTGCTAMDQVFHVDCFVCMTCSTKLRGKPFFAVEKKAYCEPCYIVSNFFLSLLFTCLAFWFWLSLVICMSMFQKGTLRYQGWSRWCLEWSHISTSGDHISFHHRLTSCHSPHTSSFPLFLCLCFVFGHQMKLSRYFYIWKLLLACRSTKAWRMLKTVNKGHIDNIFYVDI